METINKKQEETLFLYKLLFVLIKYFGSLIFGVLLLLLEGIFRRIEFRHYERLPLWEGNIIILPNHRCWWDVILVPYLYFPWWFRELPDDFFELIREFRSTSRLIIRWLLGEIKEVKIGNGENIFSKDVPITAADKHNLRHFKWLVGFIFRINREKFGGTPQERAVATRFALRVLKRGGKIVNFAEGGFLGSVGDEQKIFDITTRQPILRLLDPNFAEFVSMTGSKVLPVILIGTDRVLPRGKSLPRIWRKVIINIGELISWQIGTDPDLITDTINKVRVNLYYEAIGRVKT